MKRLEALFGVVIPNAHHIPTKVRIQQALAFLAFQYPEVDSHGICQTELKDTIGDPQKCGPGRRDRTKIHSKLIALKLRMRGVGKRLMAQDRFSDALEVASEHPSR